MSRRYSGAYKETQNDLHSIYERIGGLSEGELERLKKEVNSVDKKHGWWLMYQMRGGLLEVIERARALNKPVNKKEK